MKDNGVGIAESARDYRGHGLQGMKERLEFVNGTLDIVPDNGATLVIRVPNVIKQS
ncbi:Sensor histidine kinase DesK [compost metagenome]